MRRSLLSTAVGVSLAAGLAVPVLATSAAAAASCQGETATVVGVANTTVNGTEGADVIVSNGADTVNALGGDDLVCVTRTGADVDAGGGADSIEVRRCRAVLTPPRAPISGRAPIATSAGPERTP